MDFFELSEFDSPDEPGSGAKVQQGLIDKLNVARYLADRSFVITSGYRTKEYNAKPEVGGKPESSHVHGLAVDIAVNTSRDRFFVLKALLEAGFERIGIGKDFIHVDIDEAKPASLIWDYYPDE